ncbi:MAG TPA: hypothetical protein VIG37_07840 [Methylomirabilota bacterium]|jgi:hypothetical protein
MSVDTEIAIMIALVPFLAVWGMLALSNRVARARSARVARQIALTEAIHRELGAVAAPEVRRGWTGYWTVSVRLPLQREGLVGAVGRITYDLFHRLDRQETPRVRLVLIPQEIRSLRRPLTLGSSRPGDRLSRAA